MLRKLHLILYLLPFSIVTDAQQQAGLDSLRAEVNRELAKQPGEFAVAFRMVGNSKKELLINEHDSYHAASTMKTPVLIETFRQSAMGKFKLSDSVTLKNEFRSIVDSSKFSLNPGDDSDSAIYTKTGTKISIYELLNAMIVRSSNLATNTVIQIVGAENVTASIRQYGAKDMKVLRGVEDQKAYDKGLNNVITAYDLMLIFLKIAEGKAVSKSASDSMINILLKQEFNTLIPAQLPQDVKVAHKTGWIKGLHHDSGIIFLPDGRKYILVLLSKNIGENEDAAVNAMGACIEIDMGICYVTELIT